MLGKISWLLLRIKSLVFFLIFGNFIKRDSKIWLFGAKPNPPGKDVFLHNTKYLYLYMQDVKDISAVWLCDNKQMRKKMQEQGLKNVYSRKSLRGILAILKAKYWFCDFSANQVSTFNCANAGIYLMNFWHGIPLKKIGYDEDKSTLEKKKIAQSGTIERNTIQNKIYNLLKVPIGCHVVSSDFDANCRKSAFGLEDPQIEILGYPRLDILFKDIPNANIFMEKDFNNIKQFKEHGKKLIFYIPTFRDTGKDVSGWLKSTNLHNFLKQNNVILICKLHPFDRSSLDFDAPEEIYKMDKDSDIYSVLKYSDVLITDYSSIYYDYLLLDRPIIYHIPDIDEYVEKCRGFYQPFEKLTAGIYTKTEDELLAAIKDVLSGIDNYAQERKQLTDKIFKYQDGDTCKRVVEYIRSLDN